MRKVLTLILVAVTVLLMVSPALADPPDKDNIKLRTFVHYPKPGKPAPTPGTCDVSSSDPATYGLTGWRLPGTFTYRVNYGTIPGTVKDPQAAIYKSFATWDATTGAVEFAEGAPSSARGYKRDGQNVVVWGSVPSGAIAVTYTWYNSVTRQAVEVDTVMGARLPWAYTDPEGINPDAKCGDLYAYDVQDILTHEVGHWMGLSDLYNSGDQDLTMYGYGEKGELKKDTLGNGDLLGTDALY